MDQTILKAAFNQFDTDSSGIITKDNLVQAMERLGHAITQEELDEII
jgi:Ca2+-binding EF-hand superfamily protein